MKSTRIKKLELLLMEHDYLSVKEICEKLQVHVNTARTDINELVNKGIAEKRYGGVVRVSLQVPTSFNERLKKNSKQKRIIARKASEIIEENDVIYIDAGTTTSMLLCGEFMLPKHITVITNNLYVINWGLLHPDYAVFALPGKVDWQLNALVGFETIESIKNFNIKKAIIGCRHISQNGILTSASAIDARIKETAISLCQQTYLLADSKKIGSPDLFTFSNLDKIDYWICDDELDEAEYYKNKFDIKII